MKCTIFIASAMLVAGSALAAPTLEQVREQESGQQQIRTQTQQIGDRIESIIGEFQRNGLGDGQDVKTLRAIRGVLGQLSAKDMERVIRLLQQARGQASPEASQRNITDAYAAQKDVIGQLRQLLIEYQRQQELFELSTRFKELAERQHVNMKSAVSLARDAGTKPLEQWLVDQKSSLQVQLSEQSSLNTEVGQAMVVLQAATQAAGSAGPTGERLKQALQTASQNRLTESVASAGDDLRQGSLFRAATNEKNARDQLREMARLIAPPLDRVGALKQSLAALDQHIEAQKKVNEASAALSNKRPDVTPVAEKQADVVDRTDLTRKDLTPLVPGAAENVKAAEEKMQQVRAALAKRDKDQAIQQGAEAAAKLEQARDVLKQELAKAEQKRNQAEQPRDAVAALKSLQEQVRQLIKDQTALADTTKSAQSDPAKLHTQSAPQASLKENTRAAQREAATQSPEALKSLGEAASKMEDAAKTLADDTQPQKAVRPQQEALASLRKAESQLTQELAKKEQAQKDLAQMQKARDELAKAIKQQEDVKADTSRQVAREQAEQKKPVTPDEAEKPAAKDAAQAKADARPEAPKPVEKPGDAQQPSQQAKADQPKQDDENAMEEQRADEPKNTAQKKPDEQKVAEQMKAEDQKTAQQPKQDEQQLAKQQKQDDQKAAEQLAKAQKQAAEQTEDAKNQLPKGADDAQAALAKAQQNMQKATEKLNKPDPKAAQPDQQKAMDNLQQAKKTLDEKIQDLQKELRTPPDPTERMNDLAKALDQAQEDLDKAMDQVTPPNPQQQAMEDLQKKQQELAEEIKKASQEQAQAPDEKAPEKATENAPEKAALENAQAAAEKASQELAANDPGNAAKAMKAAEDAMKDAQKKRGGNGGAGPGTPGGLAGKQAELRKAAEALAKAMPPTDLAAAADALGDVARKVSSATADYKDPLPPAVDQALDQAQEQLSQAATTADARDAAKAAEHAEQAQQALTQAKAALQVAQKEMANAPAIARGANQQPTPPNMNEEQLAVNGGTGDRKRIDGDGRIEGGERNNAGNSTSSYLGLPARDRQAIQQSQKEKYPAEYAPMVEQYLRNLSDQSQR